MKSFPHFKQKPGQCFCLFPPACPRSPPSVGFEPPGHFLCSPWLRTKMKQSKDKKEKNQQLQKPSDLNSSLISLSSLLSASKAASWAFLSKRQICEKNFEEIVGNYKYLLLGCVVILENWIAFLSSSILVPLSSTSFLSSPIKPESSSFIPETWDHRLETSQELRMLSGVNLQWAQF